ncbi:hypothetical protein M0811_10197 [Anaeramoeba ignava]|uniref:Uncharacterized protein n=1 Tax=Anaeramoeba ignava TaxID=1746090 RepID=A0A9Q0LGR7_ANAIG|nr:hypothetical protein M0811_10197 [Anaeramoeba ignava]
MKRSRRGRKLQKIQKNSKALNLPIRDFLRSDEFSSFQSVVDTRMKELAVKGKAEVQSFEGLNQAEFDQVYQLLNEDQPSDLICKVLMIIGKFCALYGGRYHRLKVKHVHLKLDSDQKEFFEVTQFTMKNRQRGLKKRKEKSSD